MLFQEWVEWNWNTETSDDPDFCKVIKEDQIRALEGIRRIFPTDPKAVVKVPKETFLSLPGMKEDPAFPDFTPVIDWMNENMSDKWHHYDPMHFLFASEADAIAFKLKF